MLVPALLLGVPLLFVPLAPSALGFGVLMLLSLGLAPSRVIRSRRRSPFPRRQADRSAAACPNQFA